MTLFQGLGRIFYDIYNLRYIYTHLFKWQFKKIVCVIFIQTV